MIGDDWVFEIEEEYVTRERVEARILPFSFPSVVVIALIRGQVCEVNLLQLSPSVYLLFLLLCITFLTSAASFFLAIPLGFDARKQASWKTPGRLNFLIQRKIGLSLLFLTTFIVLNSVIPISFDSFNSYGEPSLESFWTFSDVLALEIILLGVLLSLSQSPMYFVVILRNEYDVLSYPLSVKTFIFYIILVAGILTPTVDGYTQVTFALSTLFLFLLVLFLLLRRYRIRNSIISSLG